ncbi:MAG: glycine zipper 2TM domain-containing protein [Woeseiaceae bacterium]|nr:glycine zipper 2TM domain-containing protein [Woeseiaceae bacterium]NIP19858.1 glycine zipper 2TM domain-containing protein [Woeseiaceae bacterium]NIS88659.1 glycine zipper 2TM domain-containing protein [Woeseiaceae bacterium]
MKIKRIRTGIATAAALMAVSTGANAAVYDYAKVISSTPVVRYVTVRTPVRECWQETEYYTRYEGRRGSPGTTLAGAVIGGVIGHQFGSGRGNDAATIAGTMIGAAIGHGPVRRVDYARPVERCETRFRNHQEQRIDGYDVIYRYRGQKYATRMPYDPGKKIKVRVDIRPAG